MKLNVQRLRGISRSICQCQRNDSLPFAFQQQKHKGHVVKRIEPYPHTIRRRYMLNVTTVTTEGPDFHHHFISSSRCKNGSIVHRCLSSQPLAVEVSTNPKTSMMDFFGEPVTFFIRQRDDDVVEKKLTIDYVNATMTYLDSYILSVISRGKLARGGGDDQGLAAKAAHSSAIAISDLIHAAHDWCYRVHHTGEKNEVRCDSPMLVASLLSPLLVSVGAAYVHELDKEYLSRAFLSNNRGYSKVIPLMDIGFSAVKILGESTWKDCSSVCRSIELFPREIMHLYALKSLMYDDVQSALIVYTKLLEQCPGDALALSVIIDLARMVGNSEAALRAAASTASYWQERSRRSILGQSAISGHSLGSSLIAVGMATGGRYKEAEMLAETSLKSDREACSGLATWALSLAYDAEGRVSEGSSLLSGFDGTQKYEECGYLFFNSKLGGDGARFVLDRDAAHADRAALRLYDNHFDRILQYSGYHDSKSGPTFRMKPESHRRQLVHAAGGIAKNLWGNLMTSMATRVGSMGEESQSFEEVQSQSKLTVEDIFAWLPPSNSLLTQASLLLFRLTVCGIISSSDTRWRDLKEAWIKNRRIQDNYRTNNVIYNFSPCTRILSSMVLDGIYADSSLAITISSKMEIVSHLIGCIMKIKESSNKDEDLIDDNERWMEICTILSDIRTGYDHQSGKILIRDINLWDKDLQTFWEYLVFYAATKTKTHEALCMARSVCSEGVTLRPNSPEIWLRYSVILEELGDSVAAEEARAAAVSLGSGEGGRLGGE